MVFGKPPGPGVAATATRRGGASRSLHRDGRVNGSSKGKPRHTPLAPLTLIRPIYLTNFRTSERASSSSNEPYPPTALAVTLRMTIGSRVVPTTQVALAGVLTP